MNPASAQKRIAFGYNRDGNKIVINEGQAACVKLIFNYYAEGKAFPKSRAYLKEWDFPPRRTSRPGESRPYPTFSPTLTTWVLKNIPR